MTTATETTIVTAQTNPSEIDAWAIRWFDGVTRDDLRVNNRHPLGTDDVPILMMTEQTHGEKYRRMYGEWGCSREIRWADHDDDPFASVFTDRGVMSIGCYVTEFARRNGPVKLMMRPAFSRTQKRSKSQCKP